MQDYQWGSNCYYCFSQWNDKITYFPTLMGKKTTKVQPKRRKINKFKTEMINLYENSGKFNRNDWLMIIIK